MNWLLALPQLQSAFTSLGSFEGETYLVNPNALAVLEEINYKLLNEDQTLRTFRRAIGFCQNVRTNLIPLLVNAKDEQILESVISILCNLTVPVECLFSVDVMYGTDVGRHTIFELNKLLYYSKQAFTDSKSTKIIIEFMKQILESDTKLSNQKCEQINNCLLLLRNILHIPETNTNFIVPEAANPQTNCTNNISMQNIILCNLFTQSIDKVLLHLMTCTQRAYWGVTIVQLIAIMYKDQKVSTLQDMLNMWFEPSLSESSGDNESNTSSPKKASGDSSPMLTSDPTSDSSDNGIGSNCIKNDCSEDRRQTLRQKTNSTLKEVCRKAHAYQKSIMGLPLEETQNSITNILHYDEQAQKHAEEQYSQDLMKTSIIEAMEENTEENENIETTEENGSLIHNNSCLSEVLKFKPPPTIPAKMKATQPETHNQKASNSGKINNGKSTSYPQKRECASSQSELSDCGYGTQIENPEFVTTSSNDDDGPQEKPQHQKPPCNSKPRNKQRTVMSINDKSELRHKKLVKRRKSSLINMKGLVNHQPTDDDISHLLKEFTVDFLLKGYGHLVQELHAQLIRNNAIPIDTSHFFWLIAYFLKFAAQLELDIEHINTILTYDVISYLIYEGVTLCEQLELNSREAGSDLKPYLRRLHLVVTAIREFLQAIEAFKKISHLSEKDREHLQRLEIKISSTEDLRSLFVLLLRRFNPGLHTKQYLQDLIVTNHTFLLILYNLSAENQIKINMREHISQFGTLEIMYYYGLLLEDFDKNSEFVNSCILSMMSDISGDVKQINALFQPIILKTFSHILKTKDDLSDDWYDLIEYVIRKFMNRPQKGQLTLPNTSLTELTKEYNLENSICLWTQLDMDTLYWYYVQSKNSNNIVGKIVNLFDSNGNRQKSRLSVIQQLLQQDIITLLEYDDLMKFEDAEYQRAKFATPITNTKASSRNNKRDEIKMLLDLIVKDKKLSYLVWLQKLLLECCYIKLRLNNEVAAVGKYIHAEIMEPVAYHCILNKKSIPVVQWNTAQSNFMFYQPFVLLLHKLGFQLPADAGSVHAHIPDYWTAGTMYKLAKKLGSLSELSIKFDVEKFEEILHSGSGTTNEQHTIKVCRLLRPHASLKMEMKNKPEHFGITSPLSPIPKFDDNRFSAPKTIDFNSPNGFTPMPNWLQLVIRSKCNLNSASTTTENKNTDALSTLLSTKSTATSTSTSIVTTTTTITATTALTSATAPLLCQSNSNLFETNVVTSNTCSSSKDNENSLNNNTSSRNLVESKQQQQQQQQQEDPQHAKQKHDDDNDDDDDDAVMRSLDHNESICSSFYTCRTGALESEYSAMVASLYEYEIEKSDSESVASDLTCMYVSDEDEKLEVL